MTLLRAASISEGLLRAGHSDSGLVLIVGGDLAAIHAAGQMAGADLNWPILNLNVALAERLVERSPSERREEAWDALDELVGHPDPGLVLVGTDILFEPTLGYRPYEALRRLGRRAPMIATWFGEVVGQDIIRSTPGHPEYIRVRLDVPYVEVDAKGGVS